MGVIGVKISLGKTTGSKQTALAAGVAATPKLAAKLGRGPCWRKLSVRPKRTRFSPKVFDSLAVSTCGRMPLMRYPACLLLMVLLAVAAARAVSYAPAQAAATPNPAPTPAPAAAPASEKPVPITTTVELFNGKNFDGWSYYVYGKPTDITTAVQIKDGGVLAASNKPNGYISVGPPRENYQIHIEWRWSVNAPSNTNSGLLLHCSPGPLQENTWPVCFQFQLKTQRAGDIISMSTATDAEQAAAATAPRLKPASEKPFGEWNSADVIVRGDTIECTVNGVLQNKVTKCVPSSGKIGFQLEGYAFELRNLRLSPLPPAKAAAPAASDAKPATP